VALCFVRLARWHREVAVEAAAHYPVIREMSLEEKWLAYRQRPERAAARTAPRN
jgi:hypothetical protein